jgi:hypothetical protein
MARGDELARSLHGRGLSPLAALLPLATDADVEAHGIVKRGERMPVRLHSKQRQGSRDEPSPSHSIRDAIGEKDRQPHYEKMFVNQSDARNAVYGP